MLNGCKRIEKCRKNSADRHCPAIAQVGVSPVCILGVNINRGQEISLRLRTDDLQVLSTLSLSPEPWVL